MPAKPRTLWRDWLVDRIVRAAIRTMMRLPYRMRVPLAGALLRGVGGVIGYRARAEDGLGFIYPDMPKSQRRRIARGVLDNFGRVLIENYGTADQLARAEHWPPSGPGFEAAEAARAACRPILLVSGHFGNYQAVRAAMNVRGYAVGGLYRLMNNAYLNDHYVASVAGIGGPVFPRDRRGLAGFVKTLRQGGQTAMLIDQYFADGVQLDFLGYPAPTSLSAAEMALKYDAVLIPAYAQRAANGLDFEVTLEDPIPHTDPRTMTQALNDSLAARVRACPEQWFWVHRRWKPGRQARYFPPFTPDDAGADIEGDRSPPYKP